MLMTLKAKLALALVVLLGTLAACDGGQPAGTTTTPATATMQPALTAATAARTPGRMGGGFTPFVPQTVGAGSGGTTINNPIYIDGMQITNADLHTMLADIATYKDRTRL